MVLIVPIPPNIMHNISHQESYYRKPYLINQFPFFDSVQILVSNNDVFK